ncbi:MAG TPA: hypothetical protein VKG65_09290 [Terriglobales bacterium]|nr:hypothetical protein [Terriglobales bacterium]
MKHEEFRIGDEFRCGDGEWRCTDIGRRTIVAIRLDSVMVGGTSPELHRTLDRAAAEAEGWFYGPPYAVEEHVFDEDGIKGCRLSADTSEDRRTRAREAGARIREARKGVTLGGLTIEELINEGRR